MFTICANGVLGQTHLLTKEGSKYYYQGNEYSCEKLGSVYEQVEPAFKLYVRGKSLSEGGRSKIRFGIGMILGGFVSVYAGASGTISGQSPNFLAIIGFVGIFGGLSIELIGIGQKISGNNKLRRARNVFNDTMMERHGANSELSLSLAQTYNGIGFVVTF